jgi:hypothetical protein
VLVRDEALGVNIQLGFAHRSEQRDFVRDVAVVDVIWKPLNSLKNSVLDAHEEKLAEVGWIANDVSESAGAIFHLPFACQRRELRPFFPMP